MRSSAYIYGRSLWKVALEHNQAESIMEQLKELADLVAQAQSKRLSFRLIYQTLGHSKAGIDLWGRWVQMIIQNRKLDCVPEVLMHYQKWFLQHQNLEWVRVETPHSIADSQQLTLQALIEQKIRKGVACTFQINPHLVAGFRVWGSGFLWDASFQGWSNRIRINRCK